MLYENNLQAGLSSGLFEQKSNDFLHGDLVVVFLHLLQPLFVSALWIIGSADLIDDQQSWDGCFDSFEEFMEREREGEMDGEIVLIGTDLSQGKCCTACWLNQRNARS